MLPILQKSIKLNDAKTLDYIKSGKLPFYVNFSWEKDVNKYYKEIKHFSFIDIPNLNSICRPSIFDAYFETYVKRKNSKKIDNVIPEILEFTKDTVGIILYHEQLEKIIQLITKCSEQEALYFRKKMGSKHKIVEVKADFIKRTKLNGYTPKKAENLFELLLESANYSMNYLWAYSQSLQLYFNAYIRANFPGFDFNINYFNQIEPIDIKGDFYTFRKEIIKKFGNLYSNQTDLFFERAVAFAENGLLYNAAVDGDFAFTISHFRSKEYRVVYLIGFLSEIHLELNNINKARTYCDLGKRMLCSSDKDYEDDKKKFDELDEIIRGEEWKETL